MLFVYSCWVGCFGFVSVYSVLVGGLLYVVGGLRGFRFVLDFGVWVAGLCGMLVTSWSVTLVGFAVGAFVCWCVVYRLF